MRPWLRLCNCKGRYTSSHWRRRVIARSVDGCTQTEENEWSLGAPWPFNKKRAFVGLPAINCNQPMQSAGRSVPAQRSNGQAAQKWARQKRNEVRETPKAKWIAIGAWVWAGRAGLITSISAPMFPAFKPLPKVFLNPVGYLSFSSAADPPWGLSRDAPLAREPEVCAPWCRVGHGCGGHRR
jgi:hypothetical protein